MTVKPTRAKERRVQYVRPVCRSNDNDPFIGAETVHFDQQLIESLFTFVVSSSQTGSTASSNSINFIDENNAGRIFLSLFKEISNPTCSYPDKHFYKIRPADAEKRNFRLSGDRFCQHGLPRSGISHQKDSTGYFPSQFFKLFRGRQELDYFG